MDLSKVRESINDIDGKLIELLNGRYECSKQVAVAKLATNDEIFKPDREAELCDKFENVAGKMGKNNIKSIVINSRMIQYEMFYENGNATDYLAQKLSDKQKNILENGGLLELELKADLSGEKALSIKDIMFVLAQTELDIVKLDIENDKVSLTINVANDDAAKKYVTIITYMLYKETIQ